MNPPSKPIQLTSDSKRRLVELLLQERGGRTTQAPRIPRRKNDAIPVPLSLNQEGLWFLNQLFPDRTYGIPGCVRLAGKLDCESLQKSLNAIIHRHAVLRTNMTSRDGRPVQLIAECSKLPMEIVDLEAVPVATRLDEALRIAKLDAIEPFDLGKGPLIRVKLLRLAAEDHVFLINLHHIIADGWSMSVLMHELDHFYSRHRSNEPTELGELAVQYADYSEWQRTRLQGDRLDRELAFWEKHLEHASQADPLPADQVPSEKHGNTAGHLPITISSDVSSKARELARQCNVTLFTVLCSAFQCFVNHHTRESDVVIGSSFANRQQSDLEEMIGLFVNTLPMRTRFGGNPTLRELLLRTQKSVLEVHEHQELPLAKIAQHLRPTRTTDRNPFFQVVFDLLTPDRNPAVFGYGLGADVDEQRKIGDLTATPIRVDGSDARFDLAVFLWDSPDAIAGVFEYDANRFNPASVGKWVRQFQTALQLLLDTPDMNLQRLHEQLREQDLRHSYQDRDNYNNRMQQKLTFAKRKARPIPPVS